MKRILGLLIVAAVGAVIGCAFSGGMESAWIDVCTQVRSLLSWVAGLKRPESLVEVGTLLAFLLGGGWALFSFGRSNRIKAAELLLALESRYQENIELLLKVEYDKDYDTHLKPAVLKSLEPGAVLSEEESKAINELEKALRHFLTCAQVMELGVDSGVVEPACAYYLRILASENRPGKPEHPELREYLRRYWPTIYLWACVAGLPWPKKVLARIRQLPQQARMWWNGGWYFPQG